MLYCVAWEINCTIKLKLKIETIQLEEIKEVRLQHFTFSVSFILGCELVILRSSISHEHFLY